MSEYAIQEMIDALKAHLNEYLNTVWKVLGVLSVAIGWMVTSDASRLFFFENQKLAVFVSIILVLLMFTHISTLLELYRKSGVIRKKIAGQVSVDIDAIVDTYRIRSVYPVVSIMVNSLLYLCLIALIKGSLFR
jgi:hypothetical protein